MNFILSFVIILFSSSVYSAEFFDETLMTEIETRFLDSNQLVASKKIQKYREEIETRRSELFNNIVNDEMILKDESRKKAKKEALEDTKIFIYKLILEYLEKIEASDDEKEIHELARNIIELDFAVKSSGSILPIEKSYKWAKEIIKERRVFKQTGPEGEATNLVHPKTGEFLSQADLINMKNNGEDISKLNPHSKSRFWSNPGDISKISVKDRYSGKSSMYEGIKIKFPKQLGYFKKIRKSQTKPKIDVNADIDGEQVTFKIKIGSEMHSEASAGALMSALGFHVDLTQYQQNFKVILPKGMTYRDLKKDWNSYYSSYDIDKYIREISETVDGNLEIVFKEVLIETKPDELIRVGPWAFGKHGHRSLREVRALFIMNAWIANNDVKEYNNNKLVLKENKTGDFDYFNYTHDLGFAFGRLFREKPAEFPWDIVTETGTQKVVLNYWNFQNNSGFDHVSFDDARWIIRKIGQLSRAQITEAIELGGWPKEVGELLVEKMISRRNQLVSAFNLDDEIKEIPINRKLSTDNGVIQNGRLTKTEFDGYTQDFGNEISSMLENAYESIQQYAARAIILGTSNFDSLIIEPESIGLDHNLLGEIELTVDREIRKNLDQKGRDDNYLVEDTVRVRFAIGAGVILRGKLNYIKEYRLVYPVKEKRDGIYNNNFIVNALLPLHVRKAKMPDSYVLILQDGFEGSGELLLEGHAVPFDFGIEAGVGVLSQTVMSLKNNSYYVYKDVSPYKALYKTLYASLKILRIPVWWSTDISGLLFRNMYKVDLKGGDKEDKLKALDDVLINSNISALDGIAEVTQLQSNYVINRSELKIFEFLEGDERRRVDNISEIIYEKDGSIDKKREKVQVDIEKENEWNFLGNGEIKTRTYRLKGNKDQNGVINKPNIDIKILIEDKDTHSKELSESYIPFINKVALDDKFLVFSPELHSRNNLWGFSNIYLRMQYNKEAMDKIINTTELEWHDLMAASSNRDVAFWSKRRNFRDYKGRLRKIIYNYHQFLDLLAKARSANNDSERYIHLVDAIDKAIWKYEHSFDSILLQRIHSVVGVDNYYIKGMIYMPAYEEMKYPSKTPIVNERNKKLKEKLKFTEFDFRDAEEIWEVFH